MAAAIRAGAAILAIAVLSGCAVGPDFHKPAAPDVTGYTKEPLASPAAISDVHGGGAQSFASGMDIPGTWWTLFHSQPLNAIIEQALKANPTLQAAQATLREAKEEYYAGQGALFPSVSASLSSTREKISGAPYGIVTPLGLFTLNTGSVSVSYLLDIWGGTRRQIESLRAQTDYERYELEASYLSLTAGVVAAAVQEASLRGQIEATREIVGIETQDLAGLQRQFAIGATSDTAVLAEAASLAQARAQLPPLQKQLAQTRDQLTAYLGQFPSQELTETFDLASLQLPDMLPVITLSASLGSEQIGGLFGPGSAVWSLGPGLTQPLFEGGELLHKRRAAVAAFDAAAAEYRSTVVTAFQNVADSLRALQADADAVNAEAAAERAAADSLAASRRQFRVGAISYLSLLTAEQAYQQARISLVQAQAARFSDTAALFQALGGGWWNRSDIVEAKG